MQSWVTVIARRIHLWRVLVLITARTFNGWRSKLPENSLNKLSMLVNLKKRNTSGLMAVSRVVMMVVSLVSSPQLGVHVLSSAAAVTLSIALLQFQWSSVPVLWWASVHSL